MRWSSIKESEEDIKSVDAIGIADTAIKLKVSMKQYPLLLLLAWNGLIDTNFVTIDVLRENRWMNRFYWNESPFINFLQVR